MDKSLPNIILSYLYRERVFEEEEDIGAQYHSATSIDQALDLAHGTASHVMREQIDPAYLQRTYIGQGKNRRVAGTMISHAGIAYLKSLEEQPDPEPQLPLEPVNGDDHELSLVEDLTSAQAEDRSDWPPALVEVTNLLGEIDRLTKRVQTLEAWIAEWHADISEVLNGIEE